MICFAIAGSIFLVGFLCVYALAGGMVGLGFERRRPF
jgi:hypothetical protein